MDYNSEKVLNLFILFKNQFAACDQFFFWKPTIGFVKLDQLQLL